MHHFADAVSELTEYKPQAELSAYDRMWQYSTDEDRYYMDSAVKARAVRLSLKEFKFLRAW